MESWVSRQHPSHGTERSGAPPFLLFLWAWSFRAGAKKISSKCFSRRTHVILARPHFKRLFYYQNIHMGNFDCNLDFIYTRYVEPSILDVHSYHMPSKKIIYEYAESCMLTCITQTMFFFFLLQSVRLLLFSIPFIQLCFPPNCNPHSIPSV